MFNEITEKTFYFQKLMFLGIDNFVFSDKDFTHHGKCRKSLEICNVEKHLKLVTIHF